MTNPQWYVGTWNNPQISMEQASEILEKLGADKWIVASEVAKTGTPHYQMKWHMHNANKSKEMMIAEAKLYGFWCEQAQITNFTDYEQKDGVFICSWQKALNKYKDLELLQWQGQTVADLMEQNDRQITVIIDTKGNEGKTTLAKWLVKNHRAVYMPLMEDSKDYMAMALKKPKTGMYVIDVPRCETIKQQKAIWSAIETIKNGYLYDKRYSFEDEWIDPPKILVMTNEMPPIENLSVDRWRIWKITHGWGTTYLEAVGNE